MRELFMLNAAVLLCDRCKGGETKLFYIEIKCELSVRIRESTEVGVGKGIKRETRNLCW